MKISNNAQRNLSNCKVEGNLLYITDSLDRKEYLELNKVLESIGGKWNRKQKAHLFDESPLDTIEQILLTGEYTSNKDDFDLFETPTEVAKLVCSMAEITPDCVVLEPSVGKGRIADEALKYNPKTLAGIEKNTLMKKHLEEKPYTVFYEDFLEFSDELHADRIVMNPPFSKQQDIDHVIRAYDVLNPGGILVAIMSNSVTFRNNKKTVKFREFLDEKNAEVEELPAGTFKESGTMVNTCIVKLKKAV